MSSILDALKKQESEQSENGLAEGRPIEPKAVERELTGLSAYPDPIISRVPPTLLITGGLGVAALLVALLLSVYLALSRHSYDGAENVAQSAAPPAVQAPPPVPPAPVELAPVQPIPAQAVPAPAPPAVTPIQPPETPPAPPVTKPVPLPLPMRNVKTDATGLPVPSKKPTAPPTEDLSPPPPAKVKPPKAEPKAASRETVAAKSVPKKANPDAESVPMPELDTRIADEPAKPERANEAPREQPLPANLMSLPVLSEGEKARHGLSDVKVNLVRPATRTRPYASAIVNLQPVQVGEKIPDTDAILIGVEPRAIAIEIAGTGARYHIRF